MNVQTRHLMITYHGLESDVVRTTIEKTSCTSIVQCSIAVCKDCMPDEGPDRTEALQTFCASLIAGRLSEPSRSQVTLYKITIHSVHNYIQVVDGK